MKPGDVFGRWTVLDPYPGGPRALCRCACGTERTVPRNNLTMGVSKGCVKCRPHHRGPRKRLRPGQQVGFWTIVFDGEPPGHGGRRYLRVRCSVCGGERRITNERLLVTVRDHDACSECRQQERERNALSTKATMLATGISRQGIHNRIARDWTPEEAKTLPRGVSPQRLLAARRK